MRSEKLRIGAKIEVRAGGEERGKDDWGEDDWGKEESGKKGWRRDDARHIEKLMDLQ